MCFSSIFSHTLVRFSSPHGGCAHPDVIIRCPRKSLSQRSEARSFRNVLNVLLNATIVSAAVHRAHKFASAAPLFCKSVPMTSEDRGDEHVPPSFQQTKCTKSDSRSLYAKPPTIGSSFQISIHDKTKIKIVYLAEQGWYSYVKTFGS